MFSRTYTTSFSKQRKSRWKIRAVQPFNRFPLQNVAANFSRNFVPPFP
jgi:hypothetical protein